MQTDGQSDVKKSARPHESTVLSPSHAAQLPERTAARGGVHAAGTAGPARSETTGAPAGLPASPDPLLGHRTNYSAGEWRMKRR